MAEVLAGGEGGGIHGLLRRAGTEVHEGSAGPGGEPPGEAGQGRAGGLGATLPDAFTLGGLGHEDLPRLVVGEARIEGHNPALALGPGEIDVLGVGKERIRLVGILRQRNRGAGVDEE
jgi:hypothetical protein